MCVRFDPFDLKYCRVVVQKCYIFLPEPRVHGKFCDNLLYLCPLLLIQEFKTI